MADSNFLRTINFVDVATDGNFKLALEIFNTHDSLLHGGVADTDVLAMYNYFHPFKTNYANAYTVWDNQKGQGTGGTLGFYAMLDDLRANRIRLWDIAIQNVYDQTTVKYKTLLPHRRTPFQNGSNEMRIIAISTLIAAIGTDAALATLKTQITTFYTALTTARDAQTGNFGAIDTASTNMENARLAAAQAMFKNYGSLVVKYYTTPSAIANYIPVSLLQTKSQSIFTGHTNADAISHIFKRKLDVATQHIMLTNNGDGPIEFYFANGLSDNPSPAGGQVSIPPHNQQDVLLDQLGYTDANRHLYIRNSNPMEAAWQVDIV